MEQTHLADARPLTGTNAAGDGLSRVWPALVEGRAVLLRTLADEQFLYCEFAERSVPAMHPRGRVLFERFLCGVSFKALAIETGLSPSSASTILKAARSSLGIEGPAGATPAVLTIAYQVWREMIDAPEHTFEIPAGPRGLKRLCVERPDRLPPFGLSPAERQIVRFIVEGKTHREMAALRRASLRTIANQIGAVHRRLGVSGRQEVLCRLLRRHARFVAESGAL